MIVFGYKGKAVLIGHHSVLGDATVGAGIQRTDINYFRYQIQPDPLGSHLVIFTPKGKRKSLYYKCDKYAYYQLEVKGKIVFDTRDHYPIDMDEWQRIFNEQRRVAIERTKQVELALGRKLNYN